MILSNVASSNESGTKVVISKNFSSAVRTRKFGEINKVLRRTLLSEAAQKNCTIDLADRYFIQPVPCVANQISFHCQPCCAVTGDAPNNGIYLLSNSVFNRIQPAAHIFPKHSRGRPTPLLCGLI